MVSLSTVPLWLSCLLVVCIAFDSANWMRNNMARLGGRTLKQVCIPGTHNSGMMTLNGGTAFAKKCNVLNQSRSILIQLQLGVRYFDIRPVISGGKFKTGHYCSLPGGLWQGGNGEFIESIIKDINDFTRNSKELIIVNLSHSLNTDIGKRYRSFNEEEWNRLFQLLDRTQNRFFAPENAYLPSYTLGQLTNNGNRAAVVYVVNESGANLGPRLGKGYFYDRNLQLYDKYSNSNNVSKMMQDQINKMKQVSPNKYFLLSWTLTQQAIDVSTCPIGKSIGNLAAEANHQLWRIIEEVTTKAYPNIIYVDFVETPEVAEMAMVINDKLAFR